MLTFPYNLVSLMGGGLCDNNNTTSGLIYIAGVLSVSLAFPFHRKLVSPSLMLSYCYERFCVYFVLDMHIYISESFTVLNKSFRMFSVVKTWWSIYIICIDLVCSIPVRVLPASTRGLCIDWDCPIVYLSLLSLVVK